MLVTSRSSLEDANVICDTGGKNDGTVDSALLGDLSQRHLGYKIQFDNYDFIQAGLDSAKSSSVSWSSELD